MMKNIIALHLILILVFVSSFLVRACRHFHYKKNPILQRIVHGTTLEILFRLIVLFFSFFFFTICLYYGLGKSGVPNSCIVFCDGRNSSPSMAVDLNPPQPGVQEEEPWNFNHRTTSTSHPRTEPTVNGGNSS